MSANPYIKLKDGRVIDLRRLGDFAYYAPNILKIKTEKRQIIPLQFNLEQRRLHKIWEWQLSTSGMVRLIILKDRRIGMSTYVDGRSYHQVTTIPNTLAFICTHDKPSLAKIFGMSKLFYDETPSPLRPMIRYNNSTILNFENPSSRGRLTNPGLRSMIEVFPASTGNASRAGGYSIAHFSEVSFYNDPETLITSTVPNIQDYPGTIKVYESTGNGRSGFFYDQWKKAKASLTAKRKSSNFYPVFFSWLTFSEYTKSFLNEREREELMGTLDEEEIYLKEKFKASPEQLNWRRSKISDFNEDLDKFHQEYPADDEEAFIAKGTPYFPKKTLLKLRNLCPPPLKIGDVNEFGFFEIEEGPLKIWELPREDYEYVLGADVGQGLVNGNFSTIQVLRLPKGSPIIKQVAEYKNIIDPVMFAGKVAYLGKMYNEGIVAPETNAQGGGMSTLAELINIYSNIYQWHYLDRYKNSLSNKLGWETNVSTKPHLCTYMIACLAANILEINSEELVDEMLAFVRNTTGSGEADFNCTDDLLMAFMIGVFVSGTTSEIGSLLQQLEQFRERGEKKEVIIETKVSSLNHDIEYHLPDRMMVDDSDRSWLNY